MNSNQPPAEIALRCDLRGTIQEVIRDEFHVQGLETGGSLAQAVDAGSWTKCMDFVVGLRDQGALFNWEMNVLGGGELILIHWAGVQSGEDCMIVGTRTPREPCDLCHEFVHIHNDVPTVMQAAINGQRQIVRTDKGEDIGLYDDISRLNNDLVTLQRDLAKKNIELERLYAEVQRLAITDTLTGVYNRRGFWEIGARETTRAQRSGQPLAALMLDLDHFKAINDTYGHAVGDAVLVEITARCSGQLRQGDLFGRFGGEEFAVILPGSNLNAALAVAERMRESATSPVIVGQSTLTITLSVGVSILSESANSMQALLQQADAALYRAKELGRNRVCVVGEPPEQAALWRLPH